MPGEVLADGLRSWRELAGGAWSPPVDRAEAYERTSKNGARYRANYVVLTCAGALLGLVTHPMELLAVCAVCAVCGAVDACAALFNARSLSLVERAAFVGATSIIGLFMLTDAGAVILSSAFIASVACLVHATCKAPQADPI